MNEPASPAAQAAPRSNHLVGLTQRGRAGLELVASILKAASGPLRDAAARNFAEGPEGAAINATWGALTATPQAVPAALAAARTRAWADPLFRIERFCQGYAAWAIYELGIPAIEERRAVFAAQPAPATRALGTLELDPALELPAYYTATDWHLRPGGWEGYDLYGPLGRYVLPLVFKSGGFAAVPAGGNIASHRIDVLKQLPKPHYDHIYEPGSGPISTLRAARIVFPKAQLTGSDLSPTLLREGHAAAAASGLEVHLKQRDAASDTREPPESVDAVISFALQHELPLEANRGLFREMFRILRPGGDIILADPPPFRAVTPFHAVILDWDTDHRDEPYFSAACTADWEAELAAAGFTDVCAYAVGPDSYPWVTRGTKPRS